MPIEDIKTAKAPAGWRPTRDQQERINSDPRLQRMTRDDQYFFFNQQAQGARRTAPRGGQQTPPPASGGSNYFGGVFDYIAGILRGANR